MGVGLLWRIAEKDDEMVEEEGEDGVGWGGVGFGAHGVHIFWNRWKRRGGEGEMGPGRSVGP